MNNLDPRYNFATHIRIGALYIIYLAGSGHPGGALSCADILARLFSTELAPETRLPAANRFILSKGHSCPALYAAAATAGIIPHHELLSFRKLNGILQGHPHVGTTPWVETSTGSLGQGFSVAIGLAMGLRYQGVSSRVYVMLGDGELQEGEVWEGAMCAAHHQIGNLCVIIDYNKMQSDDLNANIMALEPLRAKWAAFNWHVIEIDGHDFAQIEAAFNQAKQIQGKPTVIIAHTLKGKGVSFMEGIPAWHGSVKLSQQELEQALRDLGAPEDEIPAYVDGSLWKST